MPGALAPSLVAIKRIVIDRKPNFNTFSESILCLTLRLEVKTGELHPWSLLLKWGMAVLTERGVALQRESEDSSVMLARPLETRRYTCRD